MKFKTKNIKDKSKIRTGYILAFFLLLISFLLTFYAISQYKANVINVEKSNKVISNLDLILSKLTGGEKDISGYFLTKNKQFIESHLKGRTTIDSLYEEAVVLHAAHAASTHELAAIKSKLGRTDVLINRALDSFAQENFIATPGVTNTIYRATLLNDSIQRDIAMLQSEERALLKKETARLTKTSDLIYSIIISSSIIAFFLVVFGFSRHLKENSEKIKAENMARSYEDELNQSINELRKANEEMIKMRSQEKFDATGRIARTIAHEIRNPLTNINLATDQLKTELAGDENSSFLFEMINRNSTRINQLISDLLNSTKFSDLNFEKVSINNLLDETLQLAQDRIHLNNVTLVKQYSDDICDILCDKEKLKIAFLNIVINAMEAMEGRGNAIFTIETQKLDGKCVVLMSDTGQGIDEDSLQQLFEPYFTRKQKGNGLGLTNTQNIILNHRGTIAVKSKLHQGSCFTISLKMDDLKVNM